MTTPTVTEPTRTGPTRTEPTGTHAGTIEVEPPIILPGGRRLGGVPAEHLEHEMLSLAGHLAAATCSFLLMVGEYDARRSWESWECLSCAHWLNWRCGVGMTAAREQVRVGRRLRELPVLREVFARGEISYSKVRAIARVAHPGNEAKLVELARWATASQLERACSALRRCADIADAERQLRDDEERAELRRSLTWHNDADTGDLVVRLRIPAGAAADSFRSSVGAAVQDGDGHGDGHGDDAPEVVGRARVPPAGRPARPGGGRGPGRFVAGIAGRGRRARHRRPGRHGTVARHHRERPAGVPGRSLDAALLRCRGPLGARCSGARAIGRRTWRGRTCRRWMQSCGPRSRPRWTSAVMPASRARRCGGRSTVVTAAVVGSRGATDVTGCTSTTSCGGSTAAGRIGRTCCCSARSTIGRCTAAAGRSPGRPTTRCSHGDGDVVGLRGAAAARAAGRTGRRAPPPRPGHRRRRRRQPLAG